MPPLFEFTFSEFATRRTWSLRNTCWNLQSRTSFQSLRPSSSWAMNVGVNRTGVFRAIKPAAPTPVLPLSVEFQCAISRGSEFINLASRVGEECIPFSMRPPESRPNWFQSDRRPLLVEFLAPADVAVPVRGPVTVAESSSGSLNTITPVGDPMAPSGGGDSHDHPAVEIIAEIAGREMFSRVFAGGDSVLRPIQSPMAGNQQP